MKALILARGGSKGVPRKNLIDVNGKPLLYYPIDAAKKTKQIDEVYVSSEDDEILHVARLLGAEPIRRPKELASDHSLDRDSFVHFCNTLFYDGPIVHLRATTPILDPTVIDLAISIFKKNEKILTSLRSAHQTSESAYKCFVMGDKYWEPIVDGYDASEPRQFFPETYMANGYVDIVKPEVFMLNDTFHGDKIFPFITKYSPEIDTLDDLEYVRYLMTKNNV